MSRVLPGGNQTAAVVARRLYDAFVTYHDAFRSITAQARARFERRDWTGAQADATARIALYKEWVDDAVHRAQAELGGRGNHDVWTAAKSAYSESVRDRADAEIAETFFNSVARRVQETVGSDPATTFVESEASPHTPDLSALYTSFPESTLDRDAVDRVLALFTWSVPYADRAGDARRAASIVAPDLEARCAGAPLDGIDVLRSPFYRNKGVYVVARLRSGRRVIPLILALAHGPDGIVVDAALPTTDEASVVFGFSWSYFQVDTLDPAALVEFLATLMPQKRVDELYTAIGYNRHGKTVLYRSLMRHLAEQPDARFTIAEGDQGTVMTVFTLPSFNVVFKIIKDRFDFPKSTTRKAVMEKYHFVFVRDRVGRLADAQKFEYLEFPVACFDPRVLALLFQTCSQTVRVVGDRVVLQHVYTERRVTPLNLFLKHADPAAAHDAVLDYGQAIKDLAGADIFTGDMLLKNFGVTRHGRVICYDYDELALLTDCHFRALPAPVHEEDEWAAEPAFYVGESDVFPEEFRVFLVPPGNLRDDFLAAHRDLLDVAYWRDMQTRVHTGEMLDVFPYRRRRRLRASATAGATTPRRIA
jgi:isocitrate dehydrogenase kinase/phosphatase